MKKLDDKIINNEELILKEGNKGIDITCDCCERSSQSSSLSAIDNEGQSEPRHNGFLNEKLLIVIGLSLTIPIVLLQILLSDSYHLTNLLSLALATPVQILLGRPFYIRFIRAIRHKKRFTTDTLVVLSTTVAYLYSLISIVTGSYIQFFEASSSVLTIFTIGEYLENRILKTTSESIRSLVALKPKKAVVIRNDGKKEEEDVIDADDIIVGDIVVTKPGEKVATDGFILHGESSVDESMITGESIPINKKIGDKVIGGSINKNGYLQFKATSIGSHTVLASIIETVKRAKISKAPVQRIADRAVQYFMPVILSIAIASSLYWLLVSHQSISFAVTVFATILVVSCPCALGIATPLVISLGIDKAAKQGVLIKGGQYLEKLASIDTVVFDKTGTLTTGKPEVTDIIISNNIYKEFELLQLAASAEIKSEHPIAQAIVRKASEKSIPTLKISEFNSLTGRGVVASYFEKRIFVGNLGRNYYNEVIIPENLQTNIAKLESEGKTVVAVFIEEQLVGLMAVADTLRENAKQVIDEIQHNMMKNKEIILMSGDNERTANAIAKKLGIKKVLSEILPETKASEIKKLQNQGRKVVMVGDGINDAPALTQADVGIAIGSGTDVALSAGHIILLKSDLRQIVYALKIGQLSMGKIKQNLTVSFVYNIVTISIAAGLFYSVTNSLVLTPSLAALGWVISDSAVFGNSLLVKLKNEYPIK